MHSDRLKRAFDIIVSATVLIVGSPLLVAVAVAIALDSGLPVFYRGLRVGRRGQPMYMLKFRTMVVDADRRGGTSTPADDPRLTRVGRWLRAAKLDEFPQFINVLRGDMSLVGPRPQVEWAVKLYSEEERHLLDVRPGITDFASIRFRDEAGILAGHADPDLAYLELIAPEKIRLGLAYVRQRSLWLDLKILLATALTIAGADVSWVYPKPSSSSAHLTQESRP